MRTPVEFAEQIAGYAGRLRDELGGTGLAEKFLPRCAVVWTLITRIPLPGALMGSGLPSLTADAMTMLPLMGGLFGLAAAIPAYLAAQVLPHAAAAWVACGLYTALGWSLHLDGWGDLWDGIGSGRKGDEMLKVMKDSSTGAFGASGIVLAIAIRASLLSSVGADKWIPVCAVAAGVGRFAAAVTARIGEHPWEDGMSRDVVRDFEGYQLFCAFAAACILLPFDPNGWAAGMIASCLSGAGFAHLARKNLGGTNGDVLGASAVAGELIVMAACL
ncbi:MAG: adenosylcobinamide-GDP ribazoletransferase [Synergistaceae bacterium]|nr:adenosylcobinamide-GDP ribazoletransferase [Synergistaceae bacterium]